MFWTDSSSNWMKYSGESITTNAIIYNEAQVNSISSPVARALRSFPSSPFRASRLSSALALLACPCSSLILWKACEGGRCQLRKNKFKRRNDQYSCYSNLSDRKTLTRNTIMLELDGHKRGVIGEFGSLWEQKSGRK